jgi:hypothetical protein
LNHAEADKDNSDLQVSDMEDCVEKQGQEWIVESRSKSADGESDREQPKVPFHDNEGREGG